MMFRKNRRQSAPQPSENTPRFSLIRALSTKFSSATHSKSISQAEIAPFAVGEGGKSSNGFFSRLFSKTPAKNADECSVERKPSIWKRSKSFLKPKTRDIAEGPDSTIELPRVRKLQLPKLKIKGSGSMCRLDLEGFELGEKSSVTVDTDALLQRMFELNDAAYRELQQKHQPAQETFLSPVLTAVTLLETLKEGIEQENNEQDGINNEQHILLNQNNEQHILLNENNEQHILLNQNNEQLNDHYHQSSRSMHHFQDNPQLDSPLLSDSSQSFSLPLTDMESLQESEFSNSESDSQIEVQDGHSTPYSLDEMVEMFGLLEVKEPVKRSDGSIHYHLEMSDGEAESIIFQDWRHLVAANETKSLELMPRSELLYQQESKAFAKSLSDLKELQEQEAQHSGTRSLGSRIANLVAFFEQGATGK